MSIEQVIEANTAALKELTAAIQSFGALPKHAEKAGKEVVHAHALPAQKEPATEEPATEEPATEEAAPLTLLDVTKAFQNVIKANGRAAAVGLLKKYKGEKLSDVQVGDYANFVEDANLLVKAKG